MTWNIKEFVNLRYIMPDGKIFIMTKIIEAFTAKYSAKYLFWIERSLAGGFLLRHRETPVKALSCEFCEYFLEHLFLTTRILTTCSGTTFLFQNYWLFLSRMVFRKFSHLHHYHQYFFSSIPIFPLSLHFKVSNFPA